MRHLFEGLYRRRENQRSRFTLVAAPESGIPEKYFKVLSTLYMPHVVERQLAARGERVIFQGQTWTFPLRPSASGELGQLARERWRGQLLHYAHEGVLGFGGEKASAIRELPHPCKELWRRKRQRRT